MNNETWTVPIKDFIGLKSKMYTFIIKDNHDCNKAKIINRNNLDDELKYKTYKKV